MTSDEALYEAWTKGDLAAFDALYARHERMLFGFIRKQLADPSEAEDVLHEAFLAVLKDKAGAAAARSFRAWLFGVARHLCMNRDRTRARAAKAAQTELRTERELEAAPDALLERRERETGLSSAVARLPRQLAELYALRSGGMTYEEMAEVLAVPIGTVKSRLHQMVEQLREEMKG